MDVLPFVMVTVSFFFRYLLKHARVYKAMCYSMCNMHDASTPQHVAYNSSKFEHSDEARLAIQAIIGDTS